jgi:hypothetical protein
MGLNSPTDYTSEPHLMGSTDDFLNDIRAQLAPEDTVLKEARERRDTLSAAAMTFRGAQRTFASGSLAHGTANCPIHWRDKGLDADGGLVLNRTYYPDLGPDSARGGGPNGIVEAVRDHIDPLVRESYPKARLTITKRAIYIAIGEPMPGGEDPTVDLVVGFERRNAAGLWIPNTEQRRWDPSHPEQHTTLLTGEPKQLRVTRARAIRLAKAENKREGTPPVCSFNLEAFGLMFVEPGMGQARALLAMWDEGASDLARRLTPDPAGVSAAIKVADRDRAVRRLRNAADQLASALDRDDDPEWVREQLKGLWPEFVASSRYGLSKARSIDSARRGSGLKVSSSGLLSGTSGLALKDPRSFGESRDR